MRDWRPLFVFVSILSLHPPATANPACAEETLRLNEILAAPARDWDGSGAFSSRDDEWVEVINPGTGPIDLSSFMLTDGDSLPRFRFDGALAAGAVLLVTGRMSYDWERANGQPAFGLSLGNTGDTVMLWHLSGTDTTLVESYTYRAHESAADRSVGRAIDSPNGWQLFDALNPYTGSALPAGNGCAPTPGAINTCGLTEAPATSWGRLKALYR